MEEESKDEQLKNDELTKEQILERYRKENGHGVERYKKSYEFSYRIGYIVFIVFAIAIFIVEYKLCHQFEFAYGYLSTFSGVGGSISLTRGILIKEKSSIILGAIEIATAIAFFICFILLLM